MGWSRQTTTGAVLYIAFGVVGLAAYSACIARVLLVPYEFWVWGFSFLALFVLAMGMLIFTFIPPSRKKALVFLAAVTTVVAGCLAARAIRREATLSFLQPRVPRLEALISQLRSVPTLRQVRTGGEYAWLQYGPEKELVTRSEYLKRANVDEAVYEGVVRETHELGFFLMDRGDGWVVFHRGGWFKYGCGVLRVERGASPPKPGDAAWPDRFARIEHLSGQWYYFETG